jgi:hypothetical protein
MRFAMMDSCSRARTPADSIVARGSANGLPDRGRFLCVGKTSDEKQEKDLLGHAVEELEHREAADDQAAIRIHHRGVAHQRPHLAHSPECLADSDLGDYFVAARLDERVAFGAHLLHLFRKDIVKNRHGRMIPRDHARLAC